MSKETDNEKRALMRCLLTTTEVLSNVESTMSSNLDTLTRTNQTLQRLMKIWESQLENMQELAGHTRDIPSFEEHDGC